MSIAQMRIRTEYSFKQAYGPIDKIIKRLKDIKCPAAAIVDYGSTWGHVEWDKKCRAAGIIPMFGYECAVGDTERSMWFVARNNAGLKELYNCSTLSYQQGLKTKRGLMPRLYDVDVLSISKNIMIFAGDYTDEDFLVKCGAILDLNPSSRVLNKAKEGLAARTKLKTVVTSDNNYPSIEDRQIYELIGSLKTSPQHIIEEVKGIVAKVDLPVAPMIKVDGDLEKLCRDGIKFRKLKWNSTYEKRLKHELEQIRNKDFDSYFLIVSDMVRHAKEIMLVGPSRGSAAGSLVCYLTRITEVDPIPPGLYFERFIDVTRKDLPDIDLDFPDNKRHLIFEYMTEKYKNVCHIGTVNRYKPRSAIVHVAKRLRIPPSATWAVKNAMIERSSADARANNCLLDTLENTPAGQQLLEMYPQIKMATELEGHSSHTGVHAAGLLVCNDRIENYVTIDNEGIAQVDKKGIETLGLLKIDVLGLRTLGIIEDAGVNVDWYNLKFNDKKTYEKVFNAKQFSGIFQFEGQAMRDVSKDMDFTSISDVDAVTALARPGPFAGGVTQEYLERKKGKKFKAIHPFVEEIMEPTYGLPIYQEQTLAIVRKIGLFNWEDTGAIRKAMSKSMGLDFFQKYYEKFKVGAVSQGLTEENAKEIWTMIDAMGTWQMNKAHTYSYAVISYWTAYLKAHFPLEFAKANLSNIRDEDSAIRLLREMTEAGLKYMPFDPLISEETWSIKDGKLVAGYDTLNGFGPNKSKAYVEARKNNKLTKEMIKKAIDAASNYNDLYPMKTKYGHIYENPKLENIASRIYKLHELDGTQEGSCVYLGKLVKKNPREINEEAFVKKRGGQVLDGPKDFLDIVIKDDHDSIISRIDRFRYKKIGKELLDSVPIDATLLIRSKFIKGIRFGFVQKWKVIDE